VDETLALAQKTVKGIDTTVGENSTLAYQLDSTLEEIKALSQSIRRLADYLERHPESVIWGK